MTDIAAFEREALLAEYLVWRNVSTPRPREAAQDAQLLLALRHGVCCAGARRGPGDHLALRLGFLDVHELGCRCAAVRVAQTPRSVASSFIRDLPAKPRDAKSPLEVPEGQAVLGDVQVGVLALAVLQRRCRP
ncbi:hypothetical protein GCM10020221_01990 [Streptomyces thioluteus]|uniref:Uncharacterized protein n=1 Tax=Streptomyces thioluteus TaxID=66431 RepID=A0ABN3WAX8_STRTU